MAGSFVHLHVHTEYSLVDSIIKIKPLVQSVAEAGMPAVAVTDQSNLFAMVKFYRAAMAAGVKPLIGADLWVADEESSAPSRLVVLCLHHDGLLQLNRLITRSYTEGQVRGVPIVNKAWLNDGTDGLLALSGGRDSNISKAIFSGDIELAQTCIDEWRGIFADNYYLEIQRTGREHDENMLHSTIEIALKHELPVVASNDVRFLAASDYEAHEARVCIHEGRTLNDTRRIHHYSEQQYLRSTEEMLELFSDIPEAIENTIEIARRCNLELELGKNYLPEFPVPEGKTVAGYLQEQSVKGLEHRLQAIYSEHPERLTGERKMYDDRLEMELNVITEMDFPGYFLIVADFIDWAKKNKIPVGPGRGSGAGSLVAYALGITDLDPIHYELLFERFLNPERVSMPDFDVDFCMERRDEVIDYVARTYGRNQVSQIITYGSMAAKAVIRDVGRVLGHPYGFVDQIAKLIPFEIGVTLDKALELEDELQHRYNDDDDVHALIDLAKKLEGCARNAGKHAGGVVISPTDLTDFTPLYCEQGATTTVTQLDKDDVEAVGLVKFDFLGLRTLTIIDWAIQTINEERKQTNEEPLDISKIAMDDKKSFELLKRCQTTAVFQLESRGMKDLIKRLQPDTFEEIIALVALFRPGPLQSGMVDDFINRKHGRAVVNYPHNDLEPILKPTYGVILYQEQVMQIAQVLARYTLGGADLLRRAMGKKKPQEMAKQRVVFTDGAIKNGVEERTAEYIFDLMEKFAGYGFNKSHSAAYALLAYQTAWLKAHYPAAFMAAVLSADLDNTDKIVTIIDECRHMKLKIRPPDVNLCNHVFTASGMDTIFYGLGAIKGVGESAIESIIRSRNETGKFESLFDLCQRINLRKANRRVLEAMIRSGALDSLGPGRATLLASLPKALQLAEQASRNAEAGQDDLFGGGEASLSGDARYIEAAEWDEEHRLLGERDTLGLYLTGHPINRYEEELKQITSMKLAELKPSRDQSVVVAGMVIAMQTRNTRQGDRMAYITLDDRSGRVEVAVFPEEFQNYRNLLTKDKVLVIDGLVSVDDYSGAFRMRANRIFDVDEARETYARHLLIKIDSDIAGNGFLKSLAQTLEPFRDGRCQVMLDYVHQDAQARIPLGKGWRVKPTDELLNRLRNLSGADHVRVIY
ncbi:MAG: DNA polymerase III subunit alpha [Gammaproteobacteria bacterium]|nr:MAG: DNA polymerase III subunit alpha [Gammaproteobacteria bacterium]